MKVSNEQEALEWMKDYEIGTPWPLNFELTMVVLLQNLNRRLENLENNQLRSLASKADSDG